MHAITHEEILTVIVLLALISCQGEWDCVTLINGTIASHIETFKCENKKNDICWKRINRDTYRKYWIAPLYPQTLPSEESPSRKTNFVRLAEFWPKGLRASCDACLCKIQLDLGFQQFGVVLHSLENPHPLDFLYFAQIDKWLLGDVLPLELACSPDALSFD